MRGCLGDLICLGVYLSAVAIAVAFTLGVIVLAKPVIIAMSLPLYAVVGLIYCIVVPNLTLALADLPLKKWGLR